MGLGPMIKGRRFHPVEGLLLSRGNMGFAEKERAKSVET